ncbi:hypothetical protein KHA93_02220 [Bacillus sp. FJAT-49732]|uniref:Uncharacterized protein n=1 Tax=Lederbergia citrisecunda TaxID=2833583 RepID=A0A942TKR9_9BACI|nr:hypothetical protein [Lederbergia citrisecunda]MBS4198462.1 hypothetical protein [Lederbergia citrisecunda]
MKKWLIIGIPLILVLVGSAIYITKFYPGKEVKVVKEHSTSNEEQPVAEVDVEVDENENIALTNEAIKETHDRLNSLVGWGKAEKFSFKSNKEKLDSLYNDIELIIIYAKTDTVKSDMQNALDALEKAMKNEDINGLIVVHRIVHDLDGYLNDNPLDGKVWGYTETVSGNAKKALKYIQ